MRKIAKNFVAFSEMLNFIKPSCKFDIPLGVIQKLHGHDFALFWPPTYLYVDISYPDWETKIDIFGQPTHLILST